MSRFLQFREFLNEDTHEFSCVYLRFSNRFSGIIGEIRKQIDSTDIVKPTDEPHITILYGLHTTNPEDAGEILRKSGPLTFHIGSVGLFEKEDVDVVKLDIDGDSLNSYNALLKSLPFTSEFSVYNPHITLAYVKKGRGNKYASMPNPLEGKSVFVRNPKFVFSSSTGEKTAIES